MSASRARVVGTVATGALIAVLGGSAAYAGSWTGTDPAGDVVGATWTDPVIGCDIKTDVPKPDDTAHDITRLKVKHADRRVNLTAVFRDLTGGGQHMTDFELRTNEKRYSVDVFRDADGQLVATLFRQPNQAPEPNACGEVILIETGVACGGMSEKFAPAEDFVSVSIRRKCLKAPRWVKAGVSSIDYSDHTLPTDFWQPAGSDAEPGVFGPYGPKVRRG